MDFAPARRVTRAMSTQQHESLPDRLQSLAGFKVNEILNDGKESGVVALLGTFAGCATQSVVKLSRPPIPLGDPDGLASAVTLSERAPYSGMEYGYYHGVVSPEFAPALSVDVLYPGCLAAETEEARAKLLAKHVSRNTAQAPVVHRETPGSYEAAHVPYMRSIPEGAIGWVYKILAKEKEVERLLYDDPDPKVGFLLNTDPKWTTHPDPKTTPRGEWLGHASVRDLYCLGLCHRRDIRSLRDLRAEHLPLLRAMAAKGRETMRQTYGLADESLRIFVHYPPQFYHFHVHFTNVSVDVGVSTERAHLLDDIIENLERDSEHYAKCSITCRMGERDELWRRYREAKAAGGAGETSS